MNERYFYRIDRNTQRDWMLFLLECEVDVAVDDNHVWIPASVDDRAFAKIGCRLPGERFVSRDNTTLTLMGQRVPVQTLPKLDWRKLTEFVTLELPTAALGAPFEPANAVRFELSRGGLECIPCAGIFDLSELVGWANKVTTWRLRRLKYCHDGYRALVIGEPLPSIPCQYFVSNDRILTPSGMKWLPCVNAQTVLETFSIKSDQWLLWETTNRWSSIPDSIFVALSRSSLRLAVQNQSLEPSTT